MIMPPQRTNAEAGVVYYIRCSMMREVDGKHHPVVEIIMNDMEKRTGQIRGRSQLASRSYRCHHLDYTRMQNSRS